jgi:hypothetical protein
MMTHFQIAVLVFAVWGLGFGMGTLAGVWLVIRR